MSEMELGSRDDVVTKADIEHTLKRLSFQERDTVLPKIMKYKCSQETQSSAL